MRVGRAQPVAARQQRVAGEKVGGDETRDRGIVVSSAFSLELFKRVSRQRSKEIKAEMGPR